MSVLKHLARAVFAVWYLAAFLLLTLIFGISCLVASLFSKRAARVFSGQIWAASVFGPALIRLDVTGQENIPKDGGFVVCLNHRSLLDIPAAAMGTGLPLTWLAKASLGRIPLFGWCLKRAHMLIEREGGTEAAKKMVEEATARLKNKEIIAIFPEGTRNRGESDLLPFKKGAFILAKHTGAMILPIAIWNTGNLWPKGAFVPHTGTINLSIGEPLKFNQKESLITITQKSYDTLYKLYTDLKEKSQKALDGGEREALAASEAADGKAEAVEDKAGAAEGKGEAGEDKAGAAEDKAEAVEDKAGAAEGKGEAAASGEIKPEAKGPESTKPEDSQAEKIGAAAGKAPDNNS
jgi:1-acyl-sn-glycerol-3-phosphate acyltransferase